MKTAKLQDMVKGWFIGDFEPSLHKTDAVEVAVKEYNAGDREPRHHHKIAVEYTVVARGRVRMNNAEYGPGDIVVIQPNEDADFECLEDGAITVVVKLPCAKNDKHEGKP